MSVNKLLICLSFLLLVSCTVSTESYVNSTQFPELIDQSWLSGRPCGPPCWYGLEIGKSTTQETINTLKDLPFLSNEIEQNTDHINIPCKKPSTMICANMNFNDGVLSKINTYINFPISIEQIVTQIGPPTGFDFGHMSPENFDCDITLYWKSQQMSVELYYTGQKNICDELLANNGKFSKGLNAQFLHIMTVAELNNKMSRGQGLSESGIHYFLWGGFIE